MQDKREFINDPVMSKIAGATSLADLETVLKNLNPSEIQQLGTRKKEDIYPLWLHVGQMLEKEGEPELDEKRKALINVSHGTKELTDFLQTKKTNEALKKAALEEGAKILADAFQWKAEDRQELLNIAVKNDDFESTAMILDMGAKPTNALLYQAYSAQQNSIVKYLCEASPEIAYQKDDDGNNFLMRTIKDNNGLSVYLLSVSNLDFNLNAPNFEGERILHTAIQTGNKDALAILLREGKNVDLHQTDHKKNTALHIAAKCRNLEVVKSLLVKGFTLVDAKTEEGQTALDIAYENKYFDIIKHLISRTKVDIGNLLVRAIKDEQEELIKFLLTEIEFEKDRINPNICDDNNKNGLMLAIEKKQLEVMQEVIVFFLGHPSLKLDHTDNDGNKAIHLAAKELIDFMKNCKKNEIAFLRETLIKQENLIESQNEQSEMQKKLIEDQNTQLEAQQEIIKNDQEIIEIQEKAAMETQKIFDQYKNLHEQILLKEKKEAEETIKNQTSFIQALFGRSLPEAIRCTRKKGVSFTETDGCTFVNGHPVYPLGAAVYGTNSGGLFFVESALSEEEKAEQWLKINQETAITYINKARLPQLKNHATHADVANWFNENKTKTSMRIFMAECEKTEKHNWNLNFFVFEDKILPQVFGAKIMDSSSQHMIAPSFTTLKDAIKKTNETLDKFIEKVLAHTKTESNTNVQSKDTTTQPIKNTPIPGVFVIPSSSTTNASTAPTTTTTSTTAAADTTNGTGIKLTPFGSS